MFKPRPYDPYREDHRTPAQKAASDRNFRIFKLRGLHAQMSLLTGKRREQAQKLVDQELAAMGAQSETERQAERRAKWESEK